MFFKKQKTALPLIVNMMAEYLSQEEEKTKSSLISMEDIRNKYNRLVNLGLQNSTNAKELKAIIDNQNTYNENILKAKSLIEYIKEVNQILQRNSYLVSFEQFEVICKKYNLVYNLLENYTGVIPEENIIQLENISNQLYGIKDLNKDLYFVESVKIASDGVPFSIWMKNRRILRLPSFSNKIKYRDEIWNNEIIMDYSDCPETRYNLLNYAKVKQLKSNTFLIAAPETHFIDNFKIEVRPKDPIVFQICPYGILIHSVWGEEADDEVLKRYKQTLNI